MLDQTKEQVHTIVAIVLILDGLQFLLLTLKERTSRVDELIIAHKNEFLVGMSSVFLIGISSVSTAVMLLFYVIYRREAALCRDFERENLTLRTGRNDLSAFRQRFEECAPQYKTYAMQSANCDRDIFQTLFEQAWIENDHIRDIIRNAIGRNIGSTITSCWNNITDSLDIISEILTTYTGDKCAACIQIIHFVEERNIFSAEIKTLKRDKISRAARKETKEPTDIRHTIRENTIHQRIFVGLEECIVINNLENYRKENPNYVTSSRAGKDVYNAIFIFAIPRSDGPGSVGEWSGPTATLCIDNHRGGFDKDLHLHIVEAVAWRLSIMLYRITRLGLALEGQPERKVG